MGPRPRRPSHRHRQDGCRPPRPADGRSARLMPGTRVARPAVPNVRAYPARTGPRCEDRQVETCKTGLRDLDNRIYLPRRHAMLMNRTAIAAALIALGLASAQTALAEDKMSRETYKAEKDRIEAEYKAAKERCE